MKTTLFVFCLLCATAAFGQASNPSMTSQGFSSHAQRASAQPMAQASDLLDGSSSVTVAHGEMPLSEVPLLESHAMSLGDVARSFRQERLAARKSRVMWENQTLGTDVVQSPIR